MNKIVASLILLAPVSLCSAAADYDIFMVTSGGGSSGSQILRIDETNGSVVHQVPLPPDLRPARIRPSNDGNLFVTSLLDHKVAKINPLTGEVLHSFAFARPYGVAVTDSVLYVGSIATDPRSVDRRTPDGSAISGDGFPIATYQNNIPIDMRLSPGGGDLFVSATRLRKYDPVSGEVADFALSNSSSTMEPSAGFFTFGPDGDIFVNSHTSISRYNESGVFEQVFATGLSGVGGSQGSGTIFFGPNGNLYASEFASGLVEFDGATGARVRRFALDAGDFAFVQVPEPSLPAAAMLLLFSLFPRRRPLHHARQRGDRLE